MRNLKHKKFNSKEISPFSRDDIRKTSGNRRLDKIKQVQKITLNISMSFRRSETTENS